VTLLESEIPAHTHALRGSAGDADLQSPGSGNVMAQSAGAFAYQTNAAQNLTPLAPQALTPSGGDQPHNNMMPFLTFYFNIAMQGVFPPRS
jgi:microcystin-dependent protein